ncbi:MAG: DUF2892 domain-containing protein [Candidatus Fonsibacter sp.]|jgi:hypothetical protein|nr:DUF2892 domain-containing protein [Candidatus Fonsibacter ubiquis]NCW71184.1 DUF2892 domain-containing protein [Pseudomonadota bacterium]GDX35450.1 membrane protein [Pelagibacterales bacterium]NCU49858.1 DUF2892 domain-containing protein [Candidatus Fonsibacter ubiquis]NCU51691.1 DUF2892 domain-containing protein [Candidatus Fonsibacter ubiquis]
MKVNVGTIDRVLRITSGVIIITLTALGMISPWGWLAIGLIISGVIRNCTLYSLLGINTCKR